MTVSVDTGGSRHIASHHSLCLQRNGWVPPPVLPAGYLGWILATLRVSDEVFYESAGLDALMQVGANSSAVANRILVRGHLDAFFQLAVA